MSSGRSPLLLLLGVAFALWSPLLALPEGYIRWCINSPDFSRRCKEPEVRFFFNITSRSCESFNFFGCPGNFNNYDSAKDCQIFCNVCQLPPEKGPCKKKRQRWFYDPKTKDCYTFSFGGCEGNLNNFKTAQECRLKCRI